MDARTLGLACTMRAENRSEAAIYRSLLLSVLFPRLAGVSVAVGATCVSHWTPAAKPPRPAPTWSARQGQSLAVFDRRRRRRATSSTASYA